MAVSAARAAAFDILLAVEREGAYSSELLHSTRLDPLSPPDRGLCTELVMGVLRWRRFLDESIEAASKKEPARLDAEVRLALEIGIYQLSFLERIPARAAVNESVELVKRARKRSAAPFANAVLRKAADQPPRPAKPVSGAGFRELAAAYSHPAWLVERWCARYGPLAAQHVCEHDQQVPQAALRIEDPAAIDSLLSEGVELAPGSLLSSARRVVRGDITASRAFTSRQVAIQDEASQLVARLVGRGSRILDCCAAPGSKTAALATSNPEAKITAVELHPHRAQLLRERVSRPNIEILAASATELPFGAEFDRVLVDVPCSGTGTLGRNPEIKWKLRPEDLADLVARQSSILRAAMRHVAPGGRLVYSTCSLESEENEAVVEQALAGVNDFRVIDAAAELEALRSGGELAWNDIASLTSGRFLRTLPGVHPCEGFFAAILQRG